MPKPKPYVHTAREVPDFEKDLEHLLNKHSMENGSNTPDFILASFLVKCLEVFDGHVRWRQRWYGSKESVSAELAARDASVNQIKKEAKAAARASHPDAPKTISLKDLGLKDTPYYMRSGRKGKRGGPR